MIFWINLKKLKVLNYKLLFAEPMLSCACAMTRERVYSKSLFPAALGVVRESHQFKGILAAEF